MEEISNQSNSSGNSDISFTENDFLLYLDIFILKKYHKFFILGTKEILNWINRMILIDYNNKTYMTCFLPITN